MNYEEVKIIYKRILRENSKKILTKNFVTIHNLRSVSQNDDEIIRKCHKTKISEHLEIRKTEDFIWWKCNLQNCHEKIQQYVVKCDFCQWNKISYNRQYDKITWLKALDASWTSVTMNFIMKLLLLKNSAWSVMFNSILMIVDWLTKYIMFIFFKKMMTASVLTYIILWELISNHRLSRKFIINKDKLFTSKFWETFTTKLEIKHKLSIVYYLWIDKQSEQMNQTVKTYLYHYIN